MTQNIIALMIVGGVAIKVVYSLFKSITTKDKTVCGGCASCDLKHELKKKGKLTSQIDAAKEKFTISADRMRYLPGKSD